VIKKHLFLFSIILAVILALPLLSQQGEPRAKDPKSFAAYDIFIEANHAVAAWQVEIKYSKDSMRFVGIHGGDGVFSDPADYDSRALTGGRLILASYSLEGTLPEGRVRVARVSVFQKSKAFENATLHLQALATLEGSRINGTISIVKVVE